MHNIVFPINHSMALISTLNLKMKNDQFVFLNGTGSKDPDEQVNTAVFNISTIHHYMTVILC